MLLQQVARLVQLKCTCEDPMFETLDPEVYILGVAQGRVRSVHAGLLPV